MPAFSSGMPGTALETRHRKDERLRVGADLSYAITEAWSIEASYYYVDTFSTCKLYKHDQHAVSLGVAWKFKATCAKRQIVA